MISNIDKHFSRAARTYDDVAFAQKAIASELASLLPKDRGAQAKPLNILEIGCGTGLFTSYILELFPDAEIDALDLSSSMIARAVEKFSASKINFIEKDFREFKTEKRYDLILSSSTLQWLDLEPTFKKVAELLNPKGKFLASIICKGTFSELHELRREIAPQKIPRKNLPEVSEILTALPFPPAAHYQKEFKVYYPSAVDFLQSIRKLGITGGNFSSSEIPLTRTEIFEISKAYEERYKQANQILVTYNAFFFEFLKN